VDTEEKKEGKSEDTIITLSRGCSNPSSVDHATIDIKSKGSGRQMCRMKTQRKTTINCKEETGFADMFAVCTSCVSLLKSDNEYLTHH
jgi:hypothetical protein